ncbi:MAG: M17 family metallopeptidase, partial [Patescibacteria group bacterium]|nr:M17 family metallopeptidase [Patescibacteria group bacterium]
GGILGVARGSDEPPKLIRLEYKHPTLRPIRHAQGEQVSAKGEVRPGWQNKKIVLVGKAITFDTGGLGLKPGEAMETMKLDMAGGAAILGVFSVLSRLKPKVWVVGFIPATENMPSGRALKPGDVLRIRNGKTVEVAHTDAEGRIILADALSLGVEEKPGLLLDLATLTGACMVALGEEIAGVFSTDKTAVEKLEKAAQEAGEKVWSLPLVKEYKEFLKSPVADLRNISKVKYGGAITAALFLEEFVDNVPWVHLDIAGPAYAEKDTPLVPQGGSGFGVRTILNFLENL